MDGAPPTADLGPGARPAASSPAPPTLLLLGLVVAVVSLVPLGYVLVSASTLGPTAAIDFLVRPRIGELVWNTSRLLVGGVLLSVALGVGTAWLVERSDLRHRGLWHGLMCAPLAVPAFVNGYGWISTTHAVQSYTGAVLVVSLSYYPLVYLPTVAALRRLDPGLEEVSTSLGHGRWATFWRVVLPAISTAVTGGALLVGLHLLAEYGALQLLNYPTLTTAILAQYGAAFNGAEATLLAAVLVAFCLGLLGLEVSLRRRRVFSRVGSGANRALEPVSLGRAAPALTAAMVGLVLLALGVPLVSLGRWLVRGSSTLLDGGDLAAATATTLGLAVAAGLVATAAAVPVAWLAVRHRGRLTTFVERSTYLTSALPGIVVALALVTVSIRVVPGLYQTVPLLVLGYVILFLPRALVSVRGTLELAPPVLEDVARTLGCSGPRAAARVTVPLLLPGLGAGAALVALAVSTELTATLLLSPIGTTTLSTRFWSQASSVAYGAAAPYALALILLSVPATWLLSRLSVGERR